MREWREYDNYDWNDRRSPEFMAGAWEASTRRALAGKPTQKVFKRLLAALDAMPAKELCYEWLVSRDVTEAMLDGEEVLLEFSPMYGHIPPVPVCALGALALHEGKPQELLDCAFEDESGDMQLTAEFGAYLGIKPTLAAWIAELNDARRYETPADRWVRVREAIAKRIQEPVASL